MGNHPQFSPEQKIMLAFAFMGDIESGKSVVDKTKSEKGAKDLLNSAFTNNIITDYMGHWNCENVWISAVNGEARNTNIVFVNSEGTEIVIAVAGTNFINNFDWFTEDFEVSKQVNWGPDIVNVNSNPSDQFMGQVSQGTAVALQKTWNLSSGLLPGKTLVNWLSDYMSSAAGSKITTVSVTGHSLGGAISPVLAQALADHESSWTNGHTVNIKSFIYAGPGIADARFVDYINSGKVQVSSIYNTKDVVPHSWFVPMLKEVNSLYNPFLPPDNTANGKIVARAIQWAVEQSEMPSRQNPEYAYVRWDTASKKVEQTFDGVVPPGLPATIHAGASKLSLVISGLLAGKSEKAQDALDSLIMICDIQAKDKALQIIELSPYVYYFSVFLSLLGAEHVGQYYDWVLRQGEFADALKQYVGGKSIVDMSGLDVLLNLFIMIKPTIQ